MKILSDIKDSRIEVCKICEHLTKFQFCDQCGCWIPLKASIEISKCPKNKWPNELGFMEQQ